MGPLSVKTFGNRNHADSQQVKYYFFNNSMYFKGS